MNIRSSVVAVVVAVVVSIAVPTASAQSVSGLSTKPKTRTLTTEAVEVWRTGENVPTGQPLTLAMSLLERLDVPISPESMAKALDVVRLLEREASMPEISAALLSLKGESNVEQDDALNLAVPAGATAALGDDEGASAGPMIGFQAWKLDRFFAGAFFTLGKPNKVNGSARAFGDFVRNPPAEGTSFTASGSYALWRPSFKAAKDKPTLLLGVALRFGATTATFERTIDEEVVSKEAFVIHVTPSLQLLSRTFKQADTNDEYQFGAEFGPTWRFIGGDAAQGPDFLDEDDVLGTGHRARTGLEATLFVRLNAFQPFIRITHFGKLDDKHVPGLTGRQAFFGVNVAASLFQAAREGK